MNAAATPIRRRMSRRHYGMGDEQPATTVIDVPPPGSTSSQIPLASPTDQTVSVQQLRNDAAQGLFNDLTPPAIYQGEQAYSTAQATIAAGAGTGLAFDSGGGGGGVIQRVPQLLTAPATISTQSVPGATGVLGNFTTLLGQPVSASLPWLTWGWALLIGLGIVLMMRQK